MIAIIPARGGSTRIPNKNIKIFHGKPIIVYSIETAKESQLFDRIIVSTNSEEIAEVSRSYGAEIHHRSDEMSRNEVGTQEVVKGVLDDQRGINRESVCCIYPTAPLMSVKDLIAAENELTYQGGKRYAFSVGVNPLSDAGQFYFGSPYSFECRYPLIDPETIMIPIADNRVCDINTPEDWARAEKMYLELCG